MRGITRRVRPLGEVVAIQSRNFRESPMTEQVETERRTDQINLSPVAAASKVNSTARAGGSRRTWRCGSRCSPVVAAGLRYQLFFDDRTLDGDVTTDFDGVNGRHRGPDERSPTSAAPCHRLRRHHREAGLHHRQPERHRLLRLRRLVPLSQRLYQPLSTGPAGSGQSRCNSRAFASRTAAASMVISRLGTSRG
jgi:hypothetical protein